MKKWKLLAVLLSVTMLGAFATTQVANAGPRDGASFSLVAFPVTEGEPIERGVTFTDRLETTNGVPIDGWDGGRCINLSPDPEAVDQWMCEMVVRLPDGDLTAAAAVDFGTIVGDDWQIVFAVTGGTNAFRNARGEIIVEPGPVDSGGVLVHFRLRGASSAY